MTIVIDRYHWEDEDGSVHWITTPILGLYGEVHERFFSRSYIHTQTGEARTVCGIRLTNDKYYYTLAPVSCIACLAGQHMGWRSIDSKGPP